MCKKQLGQKQLVVWVHSQLLYDILQNELHEGNIMSEN